jgi:hypothetical protein
LGDAVARASSQYHRGGDRQRYQQCCPGHPFSITPARRFKVMMTKVSAQQVTSGGNY